MVRIRLEDNFTEEEIEKGLKAFYARKFKWKKVGLFPGASIDYSLQIFTPHFSINDDALIFYFENLQRLEMSNKVQMEMVDALDLMKLLHNSKKPGYWDSDYFRGGCPHPDN